MSERIKCPYCNGVGRRPDGEPCLGCREDGWYEPGDDGYDVAVTTWAERGYDPPPPFGPETVTPHGG